MECEPQQREKKGDDEERNEEERSWGGGGGIMIRREKGTSMRSRRKAGKWRSEKTRRPEVSENWRTMERKKKGEVQTFVVKDEVKEKIDDVGG